MCVSHTGTYVLNSLKGSPCIKVTMGVEYIITEQKVRECVCCVCCADCRFSSFCTICVLVSACVCEVLWVKKQLSALSAPSNCKVWALVWQENRHFSPVCQTWYFNLDSSRVRVSGYCGNQAAVLSITMPDNAASLQFTFTKVRKKRNYNKCHLM